MKPDRKLNKPWEPRGYSDMDYAGDNNTQKIVRGQIDRQIDNSLIIVLMNYANRDLESDNFK